MHILIVEDEFSTRKLLEKTMNKWGYAFTTAENGRKALKIISEKQIDLIVSDWLMPEINGLELCQKVRALNLKHYLYIILISAQDTRKDVVIGLESGVDDFIIKPFNLDELRARIEIGARILQLEQELNQKYRAIKKNYYQTIHTFTQLLEVYNKALGGHCRRVGKLALDLAEQHPDIPPEDYPIIEAGGLLHDIGMVGMPNTLLCKRRNEMNGEEMKLFRSHPVQGELILSEVDLLRPVARLIRMHHEQYNGRGFPDGIKENQILIGARIIAAASMYDNLVHHGKVSLETVPEHLQKFRGYQLDPELVDLLIDVNMSRMEMEAKRNERSIALEDLKEGMVLARDVRMKTGAFVMAADTCVDGQTIEKLKRYMALGNISHKVFVCK